LKSGARERHIHTYIHTYIMKIQIVVMGLFVLTTWLCVMRAEGVKIRSRSSGLKRRPSMMDGREIEEDTALPVDHHHGTLSEEESNKRARRGLKRTGHGHGILSEDVTDDEAYIDVEYETPEYVSTNNEIMYFQFAKRRSHLPEGAIAKGLRPRLKDYKSVSRENDSKKYDETMHELLCFLNGLFKKRRRCSKSKCGGEWQDCPRDSDDASECKYESTTEADHHVPFRMPPPSSHDDDAVPAHSMEIRKDALGDDESEGVIQWHGAKSGTGRVPAGIHLGVNARKIRYDELFLAYRAEKGTEKATTHDRHKFQELESGVKDAHADYLDFMDTYYNRKV